MPTPVLNLRVPPELKARWVAAAEEQGLTLTDWLKTAAEHAMSLPLNGAGPPEQVAPPLDARIGVGREAVLDFPGKCKPDPKPAGKKRR